MKEILLQTWEVYMSSGLGKDGEEKEERKYLLTEPFNIQKEKPLTRHICPGRYFQSNGFSPRPPSAMLPVLPPCDIWATPAVRSQQRRRRLHLIQTFLLSGQGDGGDGGGDGVSIELPIADSRTNPANGEADGWLTTAIDWPSLPASLPHRVHLLLIPAARFLLYHCRSAAPRGPRLDKAACAIPRFVPSASFFFFIAWSKLQTSTRHLMCCAELVQTEEIHSKRPAVWKLCGRMVMWWWPGQCWLRECRCIEQISNLCHSPKRGDIAKFTVVGKKWINVIWS